MVNICKYQIIYRVSYMPGGAGFLPSTVFVPLNIGRFICGPMILSNAHPAEFKKKMILLQEKSHWSFPHKAV